MRIFCLIYCSSSKHTALQVAAEFDARSSNAKRNQWQSVHPFIFSIHNDTAEDCRAKFFSAPAKLKHETRANWINKPQHEYWFGCWSQFLSVKMPQNNSACVRREKEPLMVFFRKSFWDCIILSHGPFGPVRALAFTQHQQNKLNSLPRYLHSARVNAMCILPLL